MKRLEEDGQLYDQPLLISAEEDTVTCVPYSETSNVVSLEVPWQWHEYFKDIPKKLPKLVTF